MISVDDAKTQQEFAAHVEADYPILADPTKATARAYGVLSFLRFPNRWTYYIGVDGRLLHVDRDVSVSTAGRDIVDTLARLKIARRRPATRLDESGR